MKKLFVLLISAILLVSLSVVAFAEDYPYSQWIDWEAGKHIVFDVTDAASFSGGNDTLYNRNPPASVSFEDGLMKVTSTGAGQMLSLTFHPNSWGLETTTYPILAVTYKSSADFTFFFLQDTDTKYDFPQRPTANCTASDELTTIFVEIPVESRTSDVLTAMRFDIKNLDSEVYLRDFGVFATMADAQAYYAPAEPETPADPETPAPETADFMTVALVVAASAGVVLTLSKKR